MTFIIWGVSTVMTVKEAKTIARGEATASRRFTVTPPDVKAVREKIGLSQSEFARLMRVSIKTLQNWEQHNGHDMSRHPRS
jgi:putative transcriptional regulator